MAGRRPPRKLPCGWGVVLGCDSTCGGAMRDKLYYGDNLAILREHVATESVDLIYLDPPFNSTAEQGFDRRRRTKPVNRTEHR